MIIEDIENEMRIVAGITKLCFVSCSDGSPEMAALKDSLGATLYALKRVLADAEAAKAAEGKS